MMRGRTPRRTSWLASIKPVGPAPTIRTSVAEAIRGALMTLLLVSLPSPEACGPSDASFCRMELLRRIFQRELAVGRRSTAGQRAASGFRRPCRLRRGRLAWLAVCGQLAAEQGEESGGAPRCRL